MNYMKVILINGRTTKQGASLEMGKTSEEYSNDVAVIMMNESDMKKISVKEGEHVEVRTKFGSAVVRCIESRIDRGIAFMPYGPWANILIGGDTQGTGMPDYKGVEAKISATDKDILTIENAIKRIKEIK
ncbi:MAG: molybdopterin dinucleotide binding domain-containing protein [Candidatus Hadarchaeaceae archaeon]